MATLKITNPQIIGKLKLPAESAGKALQISATGEVESSSVTTAELAQLSGIASPIQSQLSAKLSLAGGTMSGTLAMGSNKITGLTDGSAASQDAATVSQVESLVGAIDLTPYVKADGSVVMTGALDLGAHDIVNIATIVDPFSHKSIDIANRVLFDDADFAAADYTNRYLIAQDGLGDVAMLDWHIAGEVSVASNRITTVADPLAASDAATKNYADNQDALKLALAGGTMSGVIAMGNNKITGLDAGTSANDAVNYAQLQAAQSSLFWVNPINDPDLIDDTLVAPPVSPAIGDTYIAAGTSGAWTTGHAYFHNGTSWIDLLGRAVIAGDRFGISMESPTTAGGGLLTHDNQICQIVSPTPGAITYIFRAKTNQDAVFVNNDLSSHFGHQYTYRSDISAWVEFGGISALNAGIGLSISANVLSVNLGAGIVQLPTDEVGIDVHVDGGLDIVDPTSGLHSTATDAQLSIKLDGTTLSRSVSGVKVAALGITDAEVSASAGIAQSKISGLVSALSGKEASITATTSADYYRGDKTFQPLNKTAVGLSNVDNTSDATKNSASVSLTNKTIDASLNSVSNLTVAMLASGVLDTDLSSVSALDDTIPSAKATRAYIVAQIGATGVVGDISQTSFSAANNQSAVADVTGFAFAAASVRSFKAQVSVSISATTSVYETFELMGVQTSAGFVMASSSVGDDSGVVFTITSAGQVQYTSANSTGFASNTIKFRASVTNV